VKISLFPNVISIISILATRSSGTGSGRKRRRRREGRHLCLVTLSLSLSLVRLRSEEKHAQSAFLFFEVKFQKRAHQRESEKYAKRET